LDATAIRIAAGTDGASVDHIAVQTPSGSLAVSGGQFVLAAGGIETARLLLASANAAWPDGLGNAADLVGRFFMEHPHVDAMRIRADAKAMDVEFFLERSAGMTLDGEPMATAGALVLSDEVCVAEGIGRIQLFIEPAGSHPEHPLPRVWRERRFQPSRQASDDDTLAVITSSEQVPNRRSRIVLGEACDRHGVPLPVLNWELADVDHRTVRVGVDAVEDLLLALGAEGVRKRMRRGSWPLDTLGGPHHLGTARMAHSPAHGVVDPDCRVHGVGNLFLAGGAVFPTSGYAPPTLTIIALASRLADHLGGAGYLAPVAIESWS
jgi:choline dehydrogenase-like flavoprotein